MGGTWGRDHGKCGRSARSFNAPVIWTDEDGITHVKEKPDVTGSGIGTVEGVSGLLPDVAPVAAGFAQCFHDLRGGAQQVVEQFRIAGEIAAERDELIQMADTQLSTALMSFT